MKTNHILKAACAGVLAFCLLLGLSGIGESATPKRRIKTKPSAAQIRDQVKIDGNNLVVPTTNYGVHGQDVTGGNAGTEWPKGSGNYYIFGAGPYIGAKLPGSNKKVVTVGYNPNDGTSEFGPGTIVSGVSTDPDANKIRYRVYKLDPGSKPGDADYDEWPKDDGAPVDANGKPVLVSDQDTWTVYNDANFDNHSGVNTPGDQLFMEVQQRSFSFVGAGPVNDIVFLSYKFINKGTGALSDVYMGVLVDPDLGNYNDDLAGSDTTRSIGYVYNAANTDARLKGTPGSMAYDFFKGPINSSGNELGMTSFTIFTLANDPTTDEERYNLMAGFQKDGTARASGPFDLPGDPTNQSNPDIDTAPADKRFMIASGPFQMAVGDTQTIVIGIVAAAGANNFDAVRAVKLSDEQAQTIFDKDFKVPSAPSNPAVTVTELDNQIILTWDDTVERVIDTFGRGLADYDTLDFQGYRVYKSRTLNPNDFKLATDHENNPAQYDLADGVTNISDTQLDASTGFTQTLVVKVGTDNGLRHYFIDNDVVNGHTYYYDVRSYDYQSVFQPRTLERISTSPLQAVPKAPFGRDGSKVRLAGSDTSNVAIEAIHKFGTSDGAAVIRLINSNAITGDHYEIRFNETTKPIVSQANRLQSAESDELRIPTKPTNPLAGETVWSLFNVTKSQTVISGQTQSTNTDDLSGPVVDGMVVTVSGPPPGINHDTPTAFGPDPLARWFTGKDFGGEFFFGGLDIGEHFLGSAITAGKDFVTIEIRFAPLGTPGKTQKAYKYLRGGTPNYLNTGYFEVPFTVWDVDANPPRQLNAAFVEQNGGPAANDTWLPTSSASDREYLFIFKSTYSATADPFYTSKLLNAEASDMDILYSLWPLARPGHDPATELADGQVFTITANHVNTATDVFAFSTAGPTTGKAVQQNDIDRINVVPNPYIVRNALEDSPYSR
ncbi:MAG: hypothetical protein FJY97_09195 [candidate division Zixibacteria bacterium]|nr:hypothetical protein [candidate division Zixibacteria bacterium]